MNAQFEAASLAIFVAMFFDGLDGRVARMTNTQSAFGVQYDSLSDMVSFGVAPALVAFSWALSSMGKLGWAAAFVYVAGAALRLARFNTQAATADSSFFRGLASPAAAALLASLVWSATDLGFHGEELPRVVAVLATFLTAGAGLLMVSNFRYHSFKKFDLRRRVPFVAMLLVVLVVGVVTVDPPRILLLVALVYALSGPGQLLLRRLRARRAGPCTSRFSPCFPARSAVSRQRAERRADRLRPAPSSVPVKFWRVFRGREKYRRTFLSRCLPRPDRPV